MRRTILTLPGAVFASCLLASAAFAQQSESKPPTNVVKLQVKDSTWMPWEMLGIPQINAKIPLKALQTDPETGMLVAKVRYQAGFMNTWHTHPNAHGMYVLDGVLKTHEGEYGPGSFVWFPEGGWMEHGATANNDVTILFITNKKFGISYPSDPNLPYPMHK